MLCAAAIVSVVFQGGSDHELVEAIARGFGQPAAMVLDPERNWRPFRESADDADKLRGVISLGRPFRLELAEKADGLALVAEGLPNRLVRRYQSSGYGFTMRNPSRMIGPSTDGRYRYVSDSKSTPLLSHFESPTRKRIRSHWLFSEYRYAVSFEAASWAQVVGVLRQATGAIAVESGSDVYFDVDWVKFKKALLQWAETRKLAKHDDYAKARLFAQWVNSAKTRELTKFFASPTSIVEFATSDARFERLVDDAITANATLPGFQAMLDNLGPRYERYVTIRSNGQVSIRLYSPKSNHSFVF